MPYIVLQMYQGPIGRLSLDLSSIMVTTECCIHSRRQMSRFCCLVDRRGGTIRPKCLADSGSGCIHRHIGEWNRRVAETCCDGSTFVSVRGTSEWTLAALSGPNAPRTN